MQGNTMNPLNNMPLVRGLGSDDAMSVPENNKHVNFYWMTNKYGRKVPVAVMLESEKLAKGYRHTDHQIYQDNPADRVKTPAKEDSNVTLAKAAEKMAQIAEAVTTVKEVKTQTGVPSKPKAVRRRRNVVAEAAAEIESAS